jgi:hypothetical protein
MAGNNDCQETAQSCGFTSCTAHYLHMDSHVDVCAGLAAGQWRVGALPVVGGGGGGAIHCTIGHAAHRPTHWLKAKVRWQLPRCRRWMVWLTVVRVAGKSGPLELAGLQTLMKCLWRCVTQQLAGNSGAFAKVRYVPYIHVTIARHCDMHAALAIRSIKNRHCTPSDRSTTAPTCSFCAERRNSI